MARYTAESTEFNLLRVESDEANRRPNDVRIACVTDDADKKLVIWGDKGQMQNVDAIRAATFPCVVSCDWHEPPDFAKKRGEIAWVRPGNFLKVL